MSWARAAVTILVPIACAQYGKFSLELRDSNCDELEEFLDQRTSWLCESAQATAMHPQPHRTDMDLRSINQIDPSVYAPAGQNPANGYRLDHLYLNLT